MNHTPWLVVGALVVTTFLLKGAGSLVMGDRELPSWFPRFVEYLTPALLAVLVVTQLVGSSDADGLAFDARIAGFAAALAAWRLKAPVPLVVLVAAAVTAATRALL
ncbi:AzlD domain-containing protein [Streptomyces zagrosensis]|uniref:Branched-subunit amino acid transport protein n=1 Tax=Streptomyces zagrosensis TaxID=1042984 RepID=A0A7W9Q8R8_9ACTN|nr:AzlD domain-containing protein [Streptomyces zagrosensis]MBB5935695.1 branched-subunit amino acid transport protein [Streptomyces zagrosensis]